MTRKRCLHVVSMDTSEFQALITKHHPAIAGQCKRVHNACQTAPCEIADLVQAAHIRLWQKREHLAAMLHPQAYMARTARNAARSAIREMNKFVGEPEDLNSLAGLVA